MIDRRRLSRVDVFGGMDIGHKFSVKVAEECQALRSSLVEVHKLDVKTKGAVAVQICLVACPDRAWVATSNAIC